MESSDYLYTGDSITMDLLVHFTVSDGWILERLEKGEDCDSTIAKFSADGAKVVTGEIMNSGQISIFVCFTECGDMFDVFSFSKPVECKYGTGEVNQFLCNPVCGEDGRMVMKWSFPLGGGLTQRQYLNALRLFITEYLIFEKSLSETGYASRDAKSWFSL